MEIQGLPDGQYYYRPILNDEWETCQWGMKPLDLDIVFEFQMEYQAAIYFSQQLAAEHSSGFTDASLVYRSDLVAKSARIFSQASFFRE